MIALIVQLICIAIAAIFNAVMDSVENEHVNATIFKNKNPKFWHKRVSWNQAKKIFNYKLDAWHIAKTLMLVFLFIAVVLNTFFLIPPINYALAGVVWIIVFNLFYNKIFGKK